MKIAHLSDLHMLAIAGVPPWRFLNKRLTGWANLRFKRGAVHRAAYVRHLAREVSRLRVDHVIVTGDLTNLALESEFELAREVFVQDLAIDASRITVVPGNHDVYTRGALTSRRFERYFGEWMQSDLPELAIDVGGGRFPSVKLRGGVAIVALSSAVPRPPFVAAGELGRLQLEALGRVLAHPEVARRMLVIALHHPAVDRWTRAKREIEGLRDAPALLSLLRPLQSGLLVHGHLHRRGQRVITTATGEVLQLGATSASLHNESPDRMAGFNLYEIERNELTRVEAVVFEPTSQSFRSVDVPKHG